MLPLSTSSLWKVTCLSLLAFSGLSNGLELADDLDVYERMIGPQISDEDRARWSIFTTQETYDDLHPVCVYFSLRNENG
jgi:hypothetical protein